MAFTETKEPFGEFTKLTVRHDESGNEITIIPDMGARLNHFQVNLHGESIDIIDGYADTVSLADETLSKSSLLAPYPNRVADGKYEFQGEQRQLETNKIDEHNAIHGFVSNKLFEEISSGAVDDHYELVFRYESEGDSGYPFPFAMTVTYRFGGVWLGVETKLTNIGTTNLPAGFGWHPYFKMTGTVDNLQLTLPKVKKIEVDDRLIPTGKMLRYKEFSKPAWIGETEFDTGFLFLDEQREVQLYDASHGMYITISMTGEDNPFEYFQLFIPSCRDAIAVEPMTCAANAFNNGMGLKKLAPDESLKAQFTIMVS